MPSVQRFGRQSLRTPTRDRDRLLMSYAPAFRPTLVDETMVSWVVAGTERSIVMVFRARE